MLCSMWRTRRNNRSMSFLIPVGFFWIVHVETADNNKQRGTKVFVIQEPSNAIAKLKQESPNQKPALHSMLLSRHRKCKHRNPHSFEQTPSSPPPTLHIPLIPLIPLSLQPPKALSPPYPQSLSKRTSTYPPRSQGQHVERREVELDSGHYCRLMVESLTPTTTTITVL